MSRVADPKAKAALLAAAEEAFAERGLAGAKIEDIAKAAGLSKGAFYLHFESKEAVLKHIVETWLTCCSTYFAVPSEYPEITEDADALVDFCIERDVRLYDFLWHSRSTMRVLRSCQGDYAYLIDAFKAEMRRRNREWIEQQKRDGLFRAEVDAELAATLMSGAHEELAAKITTSSVRPPIEDWIEGAIDTFMRAFGTNVLIQALERRDRTAIITGVRAYELPADSEREEGTGPTS